MRWSWCVGVSDRVQNSVVRKFDSGIFQAVDGDKVWSFSSQMFNGYVPDGGRLWNAVPEFKF